MKRLLEILESIRPDVDFVNEKKLIEGGFLDSFDVVSIISELNDEYNIRIGVTDLGPENFDSVERIMKMIKRLKG
ncbi:MAG: acyl carrier protein [Prolixibacteraceae bacterium]|jgi:acyl carrier protein|nr:acyl carrier protein [Prolixibacteraceae bacterium]HHV25540.1 acyl carrier protein [Methanosarcina sp.]